MRELDIIATTSKVKFFEVTRVLEAAIQQIAFLIADFARERRTFEPSLVTFNNVSGKSCIPVIICGIIETDITQVVTLFLVTTELGSQKPRLASALERRHNHRQNRHRHIGNVQDHRPCRNRFLGLHHHAAAIEVKVLVRRIVTRTEVTASNLDSRIRQTSDFHTIQLLVILERRREIDLAYFGFEIVLEPHTRKRRVLGFTENRIARSRKDLIFLVHPDCVRFERCRTVLELRRLVQVERRSFYIIHKIDGVIFNRIYTSRIVHPINLSRIFYRLFALFKFKASHLLAIRARSEDRGDYNCENGPQKTMGFG